ncbi:CDP-6-deoxy-delta-3,4-glucoseen reductase [Rhodocyclus tenuis]|uniref:2Fe-2S iron-sulfur cluster binding domain-containing protein n=2 Tax=Rhodocyclus TaxID=1064 RepID=A0A6L5JW28_RHOTE|nr:CDP-6-deoxy-delta-3,4-glucoseen reductase [Rhodocyclus gracilis]MQY51439.1 2Fe-2S iron-sulfur cluster binding domain-containing protein [Rhodocyclus gracilis]NJA89287.1 CDP-6-deoxy-delta-3,4-glucoseen reductase [Rhodocyclus gracilis]
MQFAVSIQPGGQQFFAAPDETILDTALRQGVFLPHGCRDGVCGACRGKVLAGTVEHGAVREQALSAADRAAGSVLLCRAYARSDLVVAVRTASTSRDIPPRTLPARVHRLQRAAPDIMIVELKLPASERLDFFAGQYIDILLADGRRRSYSLANAPADGTLLQLHIRHVDGGVFTERVFSRLAERDILRINGPHGSFYLREDSDKPLLLIAGGAGFAPIKSIVEQAIARGLSRPIALYWGGRRRADLYLGDLPEHWAAKHAHIRYVLVLSEACAADHWTGRLGLVHRAALADLPDLSAYQAYVCGSPAMVDAARRDLIEQGHLPEHEFFADAFTPAHAGASAPPTL